MVSDLPKYYGGSQSSPDTAAQGRTPTRQPLAWHAPLTGPATLLAPGTEVLARGTAYGPCDARCYDGIKLILVAPLFLCWVAGGAALWSQGRRALLLILVAAPVMSFLILTLQHGYVAARFVSYTMPPTLVVVAVGAVAIVERLSVNRLVRPLVWAVAGLSAVLMLFQFGRLTLWWNARPFEDMRTVAAIADREGEGPILTNSSRPDGLYYYLGRGRVRVVDPLALERVACSRGAPFVFIYHRYRADPVDLSCLEERGVPPIRVKQRGRGEYVDVYLVDA